MRETKVEFIIRIIVMLILLNFALVHGIKTPLAQTETEIILEVRVLGEAHDEEDIPLEDASVTVWPTDKEFEFRVSNKTDKEGIATFHLPRKTSYNISASTADYGYEQIEIDLTKMEENASVVNIKLKKSGEMGWSAIQPEFNLTNSIASVLIVVTIVIVMIGIYARRKKDRQV